jgi:hypothetical protein
LAEDLAVEEDSELGSAMFRPCALIMVILISLSYGCSPPVTQEITIQEHNAPVRNPRIQSNDGRFYHESQKSIVSIRYRNSGHSHAYRVITDLKVFLDALIVPIEEDSIGFESSLAPNASLDLRGILPDTFFEKVIDGTGRLTMEFTAQYQNEQGRRFEAFSVWRFSRSRMDFFLEDGSDGLSAPGNSRPSVPPQPSKRRTSAIPR